MTFNILTPQFQRTYGVTVQPCPPSNDFHALPNMSRDELVSIGCVLWDQDDKTIIWLYPKEWFHNIPDGLEVVNIFGDTFLFDVENADNDYRHGALSFGFIQHK